MAKKKKNATLSKTDAVNGAGTVLSKTDAINGVGTDLPKANAVNGAKTEIKTAPAPGEAAVSSMPEPSFPAISDPEPEFETRSVIETDSVVSAPAPVTTRPTYEAIALHAYQIAIARGGAPGHELEDWLQAERELGVTREA